MGKLNSKKLALTIIIGGIFILLITSVGIYMSNNPAKISSWLYKLESKKHDKMQERIFKAGYSCSSASPKLFKNVCAKLPEDSFTYPLWKEGLSEVEAECLFESFKKVALYRLEWNGDPKSDLKDFTTDADIILHACEVSEDLEYYRPDVIADNAEAMLNAWYSHKRSEGNLF